MRSPTSATRTFLPPVHPVVDITEIAYPRGCRPGFLRIPTPVMPQASLAHKAPNNIPNVMKDSPTLTKLSHSSISRSSVAFFLDPKQVYRHNGRCAQHSISKHIYNDMRCKPRTLQSRHQGFIMYLGFKQVDTDEYKRKNKAETQNPLISPAAISDDARQR